MYKIPMMQWFQQLAKWRPAAVARKNCPNRPAFQTFRKTEMFKLFESAISPNGALH